MIALLKKSYSVLRNRFETIIDRPMPFPLIEKTVRPVEAFFWKRRKRLVIDCFGDSHVSIFRRLNDHPDVGDLRFRAVVVHGATAFGLANPNSKTNAFQIFKTWLAKTPVDNPVLFMMGEVDAGFLIWWRSKKYQRSPEEMLEEAVDKYQGFLKGIRGSGRILIIASAPLPTVSECSQYPAEISNFRKEVTASQRERTDLTLLFNRKMRDWASVNGVLYLDMDSKALDPLTGVVKQELIHHDELNHHYKINPFREMAVRCLRESSFLEKITEAKLALVKTD